ncbi:4a-hydroxytetrahydrobiopterin dehydratase [Streptomyces sp. H27-C3]|uniref:4a-hydroxytetrahydrobiopterin dehydratase n=1 Tax=Streptomyces sp. H27-C3 TaxID=3046305 RepID=UPI0024B98785|nr:4a-hydroxytetrahydrobiopterin dehydratase [Streptomyces sp. H27-C3]MDJ0461630.1 4a-hydroxytetrahydrobiopterin dehydratase [Streptomyces sp. H27-C3]
MAQGPVPLTDQEIAEQLEGLPGWEQLGHEITRTYGLDYHAAVGLIVQVADHERRVCHHADIDLRIDHVRFGITTHEAGDELTAADFALAARIDAIVQAHQSVPLD